MLKISRKAISKTAKHGLNVYPLEAFGLLIGSTERNCIYAALPAGKTEHWNAINERYVGIEKELETGKKFAQSLSLDILGVYHTSSGNYDVTPIDNPPDFLKGIYILIKYCDGGESILGENIYSWNGKWESLDYRIFSKRNGSKELNPRRIISSWLAVWGEIDYGNNHLKELNPE
jgi:hypothetical protein